MTKGVYKKRITIRIQENNDFERYLASYLSRLLVNEAQLRKSLFSCFSEKIGISGIKEAAEKVLNKALSY
jgi:hypothetical protein